MLLRESRWISLSINKLSSSLLPILTSFQVSICAGSPETAQSVFKPLSCPLKSLLNLLEVLEQKTTDNT